MRWHTKDFYIPKHGDTRTRSLFAILPIRINNEARWLERINILEEFIEISYYGPDAQEVGYWEKIKFLN